jgi:hypothetical protein
MENKNYDADFFSKLEIGSFEAAKVIMPLVLDITPFKSIVDIGCGVGTWLCAANSLGIVDFDGYDGDYVDRGRLYIDVARFHAVDLAEGFSLDRRYDVALSLEVAEHLPSFKADEFIEKLTDAAPIVIFSAAIPGQGGTNHINERWQDEWRKSFAKRDYYAIDYLRPLIRGNSSVPWWYQQNIMIYCHPSASLAGNAAQAVPARVSLNLVHPDLYDQKVNHPDLYLWQALTLIPSLVQKAAVKRLKNINLRKRGQAAS